MQPISSQQVNHAKSLIDSNTFSKIQKRLIVLYLSVSILLKNNRLFHKLKSHIYWKKLIGFLLFLAAIISIFIYWNFTTNANHYFLKAIDYDKLNKYAEAISNYDKAIEINPNNADYYYNRGNSYYYLKNYNEAILNYNKAIRINPDNVDYYYY
jgi:tetratricopeptide (TPR) repeat protein